MAQRDFNFFGVIMCNKVRFRPSWRMSMRWAISLMTGLAVCSAAVMADLRTASRLLESGQADAALTLTNAYLEEAPDDVHGQYLKARALEEMGRDREAVKVYEQLVSKRPDLPDAYINLSVHYARMKRVDAARKLLLQAIDSQSSCRIAYENLSRLHAGMAERAYRLALSNGEAPAAPDVPELIASVQLSNLIPFLPAPVNDTDTGVMVAAVATADKVAVVEQPPGGVGVDLAPELFQAGRLAVRGDLFDHRAQLRRAVAGADQEELRHDQNGRDVEQHDVARLLTVGDAGRGHRGVAAQVRRTLRGVARVGHVPTSPGPAPCPAPRR